MGQLAHADGGPLSAPPATFPTLTGVTFSTVSFEANGRSESLKLPSIIDIADREGHVQRAVIDGFRRCRRIVRPDGLNVAGRGSASRAGGEEDGENQESRRKTEKNVLCFMELSPLSW